MKKNWFKKLFGEIFLIVVTLVSVSAIGVNKADASTYQDGTYSITVNPYQTGTKDVSKAGQFISTAATAVVHNDTADVTMSVSDNGAKLLGDSTVGGQEALSSDKHTLNFTLPVGTDSTVATFFVPMLRMQQQCDFSFDWSSVTKNADDQSAQINPSSPIEENSGESIDSKNDRPCWGKCYRSSLNRTEEGCFR